MQPQLDGAKLVSILESQQLDPTDKADIEKLKSPLGRDKDSTDDLQTEVLEALERHVATNLLQEAQAQGIDLYDTRAVDKLRTDLGVTQFSTEELQRMLLVAARKALPIDPNSIRSFSPKISRVNRAMAGDTASAVPTKVVVKGNF
ncbi:hypothetical protein WMF38_30270 [Sorangium sp. So ce118]